MNWNSMCKLGKRKQIRNLNFSNKKYKYCEVLQQNTNETENVSKFIHNQYLLKLHCEWKGLRNKQKFQEGNLQYM